MIDKNFTLEQNDINLASAQFTNNNTCYLINDQQNNNPIEGRIQISESATMSISILGKQFIESKQNITSTPTNSREVKSPLMCVWMKIHADLKKDNYLEDYQEIVYDDINYSVQIFLKVQPRFYLNSIQPSNRTYNIFNDQIIVNNQNNYLQSDYLKTKPNQVLRITFDQTNYQNFKQKIDEFFIDKTSRDFQNTNSIKINFKISSYNQIYNDLLIDSNENMLFIFEIKQLLFSLISNNIVSFFDIKEIINFISKLPKIEKRLNILNDLYKDQYNNYSNTLNKPLIFSTNEDKNLNDILKEVCVKSNSRFNKHNKICQISISPTRLIQNGIVTESSSRFQEDFRDVMERFEVLRCKLCEDDSIFFSGLEADSPLFHYLNTLLKDVQIANRQYQFFVQSASQLRSSACFLVHRHLGGARNLLEIQNHQTDIDAFSNTFKANARQAQTFSKHSWQIQLESSNVQQIGDIKTPCGKQVQTDGVGRISRSLMRRVHKTIFRKEANELNLISAIQIRFLGAKGMLVRDDTLQGDALCIRDSMKKFEDATCSNANQDLFVLGYSGPKNAYADRQIITLLMNLGLNQDILGKYYENNAQMLCAFIKSDDKLLDEPVSKLKEVLQTCFRMKDNIILKHLLDNHTLVRDDVLLPRLALNCAQASISDIKQSQKLRIDNAARIYGVADEWNQLKPDEVYMRVTLPERAYNNLKKVWSNKSIERLEQCDSNKKNKKVKLMLQPLVKQLERNQIFHDEDCTVTVEGWIILVKNPALHQGDIRFVKAASTHSLEAMHLKDTLVFNCTQHRPIPDMCSGSDLDGDMYFCLYDEQLIPGHLKNFEPLDQDGNSLKKMDDQFDLQFETLEQDNIKMTERDCILVDDHEIEIIDTQESTKSIEKVKEKKETQSIEGKIINNFNGFDWDQNIFIDNGLTIFDSNDSEKNITNIPLNVVNKSINYNSIEMNDFALNSIDSKNSTTDVEPTNLCLNKDQQGNWNGTESQKLEIDFSSFNTSTKSTLQFNLNEEPNLTIKNNKTDTLMISDDSKDHAENETTNSIPNTEEQLPKHFAEMTTNFLKYLSTISIGVIANSWVVWSERSNFDIVNGQFSKECQSLIVKHSLAVDAAKEGTIIKIPKLLKIWEYPDFMGGPNKFTQKSKSILGRVYQNFDVDIFRKNNETEESKMKISDQINSLINTHYDKNFESKNLATLSAVKDLQNKQSIEIAQILRINQLKDETELISGNLVSLIEAQIDRSEASDKREQSKRLFNELKGKMIRRMQKRVEKKDSRWSFEEVLKGLQSQVQSQIDSAKSDLRQFRDLNGQPVYLGLIQILQSEVGVKPEELKRKRPQFDDAEYLGLLNRDEHDMTQVETFNKKQYVLLD